MPVMEPGDNFLKRTLEPPTYGWRLADGSLSKPSARDIVACWLGRVNVFRSRTAWLALANVAWPLALLPFGVVFFARYFSWAFLFAGVAYALIGLGTLNVVWLHRYCTHRAFTFTHPFFRFIVRNLSIRIVAEEIYVVSHHVHHALTEQPGDPYNAHAGRLYCLLAAELHQPIRRGMTEKDYARTVNLVSHTGVKANSYAQYLKWGSICHPVRLCTHFALNWAFWYLAFWLIGGHGLACAIFGLSLVWAVGIRDFNYDAHGGGKDKRVEGVDFNREDLSINQTFAGSVSGEWHNNHHLFPRSVRTGFLWWQMDTAFAVIRLVKLFGGIATWRDDKERFMKEHYAPYLEARQAGAVSE